ncbi:MAG TPA: sulfite exporter TauE/SafE family protein [Geminicoccus sp.]|uniref:sulfite exporter TauE/SafE family protein n=1 Tax=Geminicoccus sp. TaxID=2024832 RepID=UPI002E359313|nr:sulfite exporter TauE/SafE family protein [Geminicoccus sp.]HEX2526346.1 sulfite exporter TauE/SafE family protein [Geminicoccus sp.]
MDDVVLYWSLVATGVIISALSKGGFGGGLGMVSVPLMSWIMPPAHAAAIMLPLLCLMDAIGVWAYRRNWDRRAVVALLPGALAGIVVGTLAFGWLSDDVVRVLLGATSVLFSLDWFFRPAARIGTGKRPGRLSGILLGGAAGFTSTIAHAGGPPANLYLVPLKLNKTVFVGTMTILFTGINLAKLPPYFAIGLFDQTIVSTILWMVPVAALAMVAGVWMHHRVSDRWFYPLCVGFVLLTGLKLLWDGLA